MTKTYWLIAIMGFVFSVTVLWKPEIILAQENSAMDDALHMEEQIRHLDEQIRKKENTVKELQIIIDQILKYEKDKNTLKSKLNTIDNLKKGQQRPVKLLDELNRRLPEQIWLQRLLTAGDLITLRGYSLSQTAIDDFMGSLSESPYFDDVKLKVNSKRKVKDRDLNEFELDMRLKI
jgi:type IV pilus assembly protein PilN